MPLGKVLPIPTTQFHYADPAANQQMKPIRAMIDHIHYPTLGCPALITEGEQLQVVLSLPKGVKSTAVTFTLQDRHTRGSFSHNLIPMSRAKSLEKGADNPEQNRKLWLYKFEITSLENALFDLTIQCHETSETQYNSVRKYAAISGEEKVVFSGDSQYHVENRECLERFVQAMNKRKDIAWIAIVGDICDNAVKKPANLIRLAAHAGQHPVAHYYAREYGDSHELLRELRHPVVIVPGNHDGMTAYERYKSGKKTDALVGKDPLNSVAYDGLHHFRRTYGPTYFSFDWNKTRYMCLNSFELGRHDRLGYHAIVSNWGGWMSDEQLEWFKATLGEARRKKLKIVVLVHHDPRGGSQGKKLGFYHLVRPYTYTKVWKILKGYLRYALKHGGTLWQQEWMRPRGMKLKDHPVQELLRALFENETWAVIMGHDNENWIDSYYEGEDPFRTERAPMKFAAKPKLDDELVESVVAMLEDEDGEGLSNLLEELEEEQAEELLRYALESTEKEIKTFSHSKNPAKEWGLTVSSAIHFIHVDDIGAYKHRKNRHFKAYGYVVSELEEGAPKNVQSVRMIPRKKAKKKVALPRS